MGADRNIQPSVIWFTGLPGAGKTTLATKLFNHLREHQIRCELLDGDEIRRQLPPLGFSKQDRDLQVLRVGEIARKFEEEGAVVLTALVSPYRDARNAVRKLTRRFIEVYVSTPLETCEGRDVKGNYRAARAGTIQNFTGVSDPYEPPENPEITVNSSRQNEQQCLEIILDYLDRNLT